MKKIFFCAKNLADYRKNFAKVMSRKQLFDPKQVHSQEEFDQKFFPAHIKTLLEIPDIVFDSPICQETDIEGLRLDFNFGLRLDVPEGNFCVKIGDADSGQIFFDEHISDVRLFSVELYFIRWQVEIFLDNRKIFEHSLNLAGKRVFVAFLFPIMGDIIAFLPFVREFKRRHNCELTISLPEYMRELAANLYPEIPQAELIDLNSYAIYYPFMLMSPCMIMPVDARNMPMERAGGTIFGIETLPPKPIFTPTEPPVTSEPYVCIAVQASVTKKGWLYPNGWDIVVDYLKRLGYRVFCIDKNSVETRDGITVRKPEGAEDFTGNRPILERANMLYHAEFFIGLSSGLSWLADAVNCPVVLISGFSQDWYEFYTPYRVANRFVCNGCLNDMNADFLGKLCPLHFDTPREFECQRKILPRQVLNAIERLILDKKLTLPSLHS